MPNKKPTRLIGASEKTLNRLFYAIRAGTTFKIACEYAGISVSAFHGWRNIGSQEEKPEDISDKYYKECIKFKQKIDKCVADNVINSLVHIQDASEKQWQAAAWLLERRHPTEYGRKDSIQADVQSKNSNVNLTANYEVVTDEDMDQIDKLLDTFISTRNDTPDYTKN